MNTASFFQNRSCGHFPCHAGVDPDAFNCLFCYCPLYALGPDCGGDFRYTESGAKDCKNCTLLHEGDAGAEIVKAKFGELKKLAAMGSAHDAPKGAGTIGASKPMPQSPLPSVAYEPVDVPADWLDDIAARIAPFDTGACQRAYDKWNAVAKPIGSLGALESDVEQMAGIIGTEDVEIPKRALVVLCADNGVVAQGVSQCGPEVTRAVATALGTGTSSACVMAHTANVDVFPVDIGMVDPGLLPTPENQMLYEAGMPLMPDPQPIPGVIDRCVGRGTGDISYGPAMTRGQALQAIRVGVDLVGDLAAQGYGIIATGEMGIGNTTTASSIVSCLVDKPAAEVVGRGAGLSDSGLANKIRVVERAVRVNACDPTDPLGVLAGLGGFDIAGMAGMFIGGALHRVPVVVDGFISAVAAYMATLLCPSCAWAIMGSHVSSELAVSLVLEALAANCQAAGVKFAPVIDAGMRLGEGTGAVCLVPLLDAALALYNGTTFDQEGIEAYEVDPT